MAERASVRPIQVRAPRRLYGRPVGLLFRGSYFVCRGIQISQGGMLIGIDLALDKGDWVLLTLILPVGSPIVVRGEIVYRKATSAGALAEYGLKFLDIKLLNRREIRNFVSAKTREEADVERERRSMARAK